MFERFIWFKQSKGLAPRTTEEYHINFRWLRDYLEQDLSREEMTLEVFNEWIDFMIIEKVLQPTTVKNSSKEDESISPLVLFRETY